MYWAIFCAIFFRNSSGRPEAEKSFFNFASLPDFLALRRRQDCQMVSFQTKNPNLGIFWRILELKMLLYILVIWNIL
jgi:hypothetical protein